MDQSLGLFCFWPFSQCQLTEPYACPFSSSVFPPPAEFWHAKQTHESDREKHTLNYQIEYMYPDSKNVLHPKNFRTDKIIQYLNSPKTLAIQI